MAVEYIMLPIGTPAPDFTLPCIATGRIFGLDRDCSYEGLAVAGITSIGRRRGNSTRGFVR